MFCGLQREGPTHRNGEDDHRLVRLLEEPPQDGAKVRNLLLHADVLRVARRSITAPPLLPVSHQEVTLEIEKPLKLADLVQQRQARATLNDQQRRPSFPFGAETDALAGAVDVEIDRSVDGVS